MNDSSPVSGLSTNQDRLPSMNQENSGQQMTMIAAIEQTWQRVIALELKFKTFNLGSGLKKSQHARLTATLDSLKDSLARMKAALEAEQELGPILHNLGLPPYQGYAPHETTLLIRMIHERRQAAQRITDFLGRFQHWLEDLSKGRAKFRAFWRARKMRKHFDTVRHGRFELAVDHEALTNNVRQTLRFLANAFTKPDKGSSLDTGLQNFHSAIHALLQSTERLEMAVELEHKQVIYMKNWLDKARAEFRSQLEEQLPSIEAIRWLSRSLDQFGFTHYYDTRKRLANARDYVEICLKQLRFAGDGQLWSENEPMFKCGEQIP